MASFKITDLTELTGGSVADTYVLEIVDLDADQSKKVTIASLKTVFSASEGSTYTGGTSNGIMFNDGDTFATSLNFVFDGETLTHTLTNGQTEDAFQINSFGNTGGDLARIMSNGNIVLNGDTATDSTVIDITSPSSDFVIRHGVKVTSTGNSNSAYYAFYANVTGTTPYSFYAASGRAFINGTLDLNYNSLLNVGNTKFIGVPSTQYGNLLVSDESDFSAGSGGQLVFGGNPVGQTGYRAAYGIIKGVKENSTYNNNLGGLAFYTNNQASGYLPLLSTLTERMRINSDGNVGIGATSPSAKLHTSLSTDIVGNRLDLSNGQTADAFQINSFGNTGGDVFRVEKGGLIHASGTNTQQSTTYTLTNVVTNGTKTITYDSNSNVKVGDVITGTNIATAAHIISVESDTEARMNVIATGSGTNSATIIPMFAGVYSNVTLSKNAGISSYYSAGLFVSPKNSDSGSSIKSAGAYIDNPSSSATTTGMYLSSKSDTILTFNRTSPSTEKHQWYMTIGDGGGTANSRGDFYIGAGEFFPKDNSHSLRIDDFGLAIGGIGYLSSDTANQAFTIWGGISSGGNVLNVRWRAANDINNTSGNVNLIAIDSTLNGQKFKPTSGTGTVNYINLSPEINQTGGASGISRAIYINPLLTSAADFRAIEVTGGNVVLALPTSSAGLPSGALWNDSGTVKIV